MITKRHGFLVLRNLLIDILIAAVLVVAFGLYRDSLEVELESKGIEIPNPYGKQAEKTEASENAASDAQKTVFPAGSSSPSKAPPTEGSGAKTRPGSRRSKAGEVYDNVAGAVESAFASKGGSAIDSESPAETNLSPLSVKFSDKYTDEVSVTENSYTSPNISVTVNEMTSSDGSIIYYVADIYVRDVTCIQTALASDTYGFGFKDSILDMAVLKNALLAVNGDYYGNSAEGVVIRNGVIYRTEETDCDVCVLYYDGSMRIIPGGSFSVEEAVNDGAWQAWTFGPALLDSQGNTIKSFSSSRRLISANPRTAIGYYEPGHYCLVVVDGRGESAGISLPELSQLFCDLGCKAAYNLDGGNSSVMVWQGEVFNDPSFGGRQSSDAILIAEVN